MNVVLAIAAVICGSIGAGVLYLTSPNQQLLAEQLPVRTGVTIGIVTLVASLLLFGQIVGPATAVYLLLTLAMFIWSVPPLLFAWLRKRKASTR